MIPKKIHYCWFGNAPYSQLIIDCMSSWQRYLPDYDFVKWDESNSPLNNVVVQKAFKQQKWAFAADYVRLHALYHEGGVYLDTDMEIIKDISPLLNHEGFIGYESEDFLSFGIAGSAPKNSIFLRCMELMEARVMSGEEFIAIPHILMQAFGKKPPNNKISSGFMVYPEDYFYPYNPYTSNRKQLMGLDIQPTTYAIHHWNASWSPTFWERIKKRVKGLK